MKRSEAWGESTRPRAGVWNAVGSCADPQKASELGDKRSQMSVSCAFEVDTHPEFRWRLRVCTCFASELLLAWDKLSPLSHFCCISPLSLSHKSSFFSLNVCFYLFICWLQALVWHVGS